MSTEPSDAARDFPAAPAPVKVHLGYIDGLRALLALYVVCVHGLPRAWDQAAPTGVWKLLAKLLSGGHLAVTAFIVVSGYCLMMPVLRANNTLRGGTWTFYWRRYLRIAPPVYAAFLLSVVCLALCRGAGQGFLYSAATPLATPREIIGHLTLMQFLMNALLPNNSVFWSITVEFVIYLWFPLLVGAWRRFGGERVTLAILVLGYAAYYALLHTPLAPLTPQYYAAFALGAAAASIAFAGDGIKTVWRERVPWTAVSAVALLFAAGLCAKLGWPRIYASHIEKIDLLIAVGVSSLLIAAPRSPRNAARSLLQLPLLERIGLFSFSLYLIHYPLLDLFEMVLNRFSLGVSARAACLALIAIPLIVLAAYGFYLAVERTAHEWSRRQRRAVAVMPTSAGGALLTPLPPSLPVVPPSREGGV